MPNYASRPLPRRPRLTLLFAFLILATGLGRAAWAGGGPENVLLVVNPESPASLRIANHYARLRQIPAGNILYLPWSPQAGSAEIDVFRKQLLAPILEAVQSRRLAGQIDYVVYSSDFPWYILLQSDVKKFQEALQEAAPKAKEPEGAAKRPVTWPAHLAPQGSLTGLTYLWEPVMAGHPGYMQLRNNFYTRSGAAEQKDRPTLGFKGTHHFGPHGELVDADGARYLLSTMIGVTFGRGNSPEEVLEYLRRSAAADGTHPRGTVYYVQNNGVRSLVRHGQFPAAVRELKALGVAAEIVEGMMPMNKPDVQGAMLGTAAFDWKASGSKILPGAICEHFTSYGGIMTANLSQTPLSEFLRYGAAGASGTVVEPYAIADKFPNPRIHVHYARGCTLAEAFYQSVFGPYQLLIVGDPLCRPWANIPQVTVSGIPTGPARGSVSLQPSAKFSGSAVADHFELFIDGRRALECKPGGSLDLDTTKLADGYHELRVVAIEAGLIRSQGRKIFPIVAANHGRRIDVKLASPATLRKDQPLTLTVKSPGSIGISILQGTRVVGRIPRAQGKVEIESSKIGSGPVQLQVIGLGKGGAQTNVAARPVDVEVEKKG